MPASFYRKVRTALTIEDVAIKLTRVVEGIEDVLSKANTTEEFIRAAHAQIAACRELARVLVDSELEKRLEALEEQLKNRQERTGLQA